MENEHFCDTLQAKYKNGFITMQITYTNAFDSIVLRYNEIGLKGGNRWRFEKRFTDNILHILKEIDDLDFLRDRGRIAIIKKDYSPFDEDEIEIINERLPLAFGLESFSPAFLSEPKWKKIKKLVLANFDDAYQAHIAEKGEGQKLAYRTRAKRSFKKFPLTSREIEIEVATEVMEKYPRLKLSLDEPEFTVGVEVRDEMAFVYFEKISGPGGLPVGASAPVLALMSGGIDSPVACYQTMKRGSHVDYLTFHSHPYTSLNVLEKIAKLVNLLNEYQINGRYLACNMMEAQKMIRDRCKPRLRTILYRRVMMRVSNIVAEYLGAEALLTGEAVGQVASQTISNMTSIDDASELLVLRPLVGYDKNDAIKIARRIGSYRISNIPAEDSCTVFAPKAPATSSKIGICAHEEKRFDMDAAIKDCLKNIVLIDPETMEEEEIPALTTIYEKCFQSRWFPELIEVTEEESDSEETPADSAE